MKTVILGYGYEQEIRRQCGSAIVIVKAERSSDRIAALDAGADAALHEDATPDEVDAAVRAAERRRRGLVVTEITVGDVIIGEHSITVWGQPAHITTKEIEVLLLLAQRPGEVVSTVALARVFQGDAINCLRVTISKLRIRLDSAAKIVNYHGRGYALVAPGYRDPSARAEPQSRGLRSFRVSASVNS